MATNNVGEKAQVTGVGRGVGVGRGGGLCGSRFRGGRGVTVCNMCGYAFR